MATERGGHGSVGASGGSSTHINTNMSRPYSEQISAGYERQLLGDLRIGINYYYRTKKNLIGIQNTAVSPSDYVPITTLEAHRFSIRSLASR